MAITQTYVDYGAGNDTSGDGSIGTPWKTLQKAFDTLIRNTTDGNQVNLKAGTAHVNAASLDLTTFVAGGALSATAPLILRGYTSAANDGGVGEVDCNGATMWTQANLAYIVMIDLECHSPGNNNLINWTSGQNRTILRCEFHKGASSPSGKTLVYVATAESLVAESYVHDAGTSGIGIYCDRIINNYIHDCATGITSAADVIGNIIKVPTNGTGFSTGLARSRLIGNVVWSGSSTGTGISVGNSYFALVANNIVVGFSGAGGKGVSATNLGLLGYNAFYNNTANYSISDQTWLDLTAGDIALAADPFTDAANGDFSLTTAALAALRSLGWPATYLGAHANTDPHITIGALQYGPTPAAGGGAVRRVMRLLGG